MRALAGEGGQTRWVSATPAATPSRVDGGNCGDGQSEILASLEDYSRSHHSIFTQTKFKGKEAWLPKGLSSAIPLTRKMLITGT